MDITPSLTAEKEPLLSKKASVFDGLQNYRRSFSELLKSPIDIWYLYAYELIAYCSATMVVLSMSLYFTEILKFSDIMTGILIAGFGVSGVLVSIGFGHYIDRHGIKKSLFLSNVFGILNFVLLYLFNNSLFYCAYAPSS
ncbi:unnamed protein product [Blepharisma stoltei]|uniref:Major facilitator superfamily (MFS) profile domain-containing protein n=1 Tax=Blepharisma stoltei TaxID=1481888 RepID=A0AAU9K6E8_9CILI|nr:unnamed protein product [Blepharisma stoltei]